MRAILVGLLLAGTLTGVSARPAAAQFEEPCELACIGVLSATSFITATGASIAVGRLSGGLSTVNQGLLAWGTTFAVVAGGGMALSGNGQRQERAVYSAGIGLLAGAATGLVFEALRTDGDGPRVLAATFIGAAVGALAGGAYGALSYDDDPTSDPVPLLSVGIRF